MEKKYYIYLHIKETDGQPFYVGKGKGRRYKSHLYLSDNDTNLHKKNIIQKIYDEGLQPEIIIYGNNLSEFQSLELERKRVIFAVQSIMPCF